jgi:hypothetical protein
MLRVLGFATLVLVAICLAVGASIALADDGAQDAVAKPNERTIEAIDPDRRMIDDSLASALDISAFGAFAAPLEL